MTPHSKAYHGFCFWLDVAAGRLRASASRIVNGVPVERQVTRDEALRYMAEYGAELCG